MPHIQPLSDDQISAEAKPMTDAIQDNLGFVLNIFRTMAHAPPILNATLTFNQAIQADLPGDYRELAYLKATAVNNCDY